jgi:hypothetical protein
VQEGFGLEKIRLIVLRRLLLLSLSLFGAAYFAIRETLAQTLPLPGLGAIFLLLIVAFLAGTSLTMRSAARQIRNLLRQQPTPSGFPAAAPRPIDVLTMLRGK